MELAYNSISIDAHAYSNKNPTLMSPAERVRVTFAICGIKLIANSADAT